MLYLEEDESNKIKGMIQEKTVALCNNKANTFFVNTVYNYDKVEIFGRNCKNV
jgi:hypothetical protein